MAIGFSQTVPGGSTTQLQYNNAGVFGGTSGLTWNNSTNALSFATSQELQFRQTTNRIYSNTTDQLTIEGNTTTLVGKEGDTGFGIVGQSSTYAIYPLTASKFGIGTLTNPWLNLFLTQVTLGSAIYSLSSTATNDDPIEYLYQNRVATTDGTQTTIHTFTVPSSTSYMIEAYVTARRTGGSSGTAEDGAGYVIRGIYKNTAGTVAIIGAVNADFTAESQAGWDATFTTSGATVLCRVTGATNNNVTWHMTARVWQVAS